MASTAFFLSCIIVHLLLSNTYSHLNNFRHTNSKNAVHRLPPCPALRGFSRSLLPHCASSRQREQPPTHLWGSGGRGEDDALHPGPRRREVLHPQCGCREVNTDGRPVSPCSVSRCVAYIRPSTPEAERLTPPSGRGRIRRP